MVKLFAMLMKTIDKGWTYVLVGGQEMTEAMMVSKGVTLITNTEIFH